MENKKYTVKEILYVIFFPFKKLKDEPRYFIYYRKAQRIMQLVMIMLTIVYFYIGQKNQFFLEILMATFVLIIIYATINKNYLSLEKEHMELLKNREEDKEFHLKLEN